MDATPSRLSEACVEDSDDPPMHSCRHCSGPFPAEWNEYNALMVDLMQVGAAEQAGREGCTMWERLMERWDDDEIDGTLVRYLRIVRVPGLKGFEDCEPHLSAWIETRTSSGEWAGSSVFGTCHDVTARNTPGE